MSPPPSDQSPIPDRRICGHTKHCATHWAFDASGSLNSAFHYGQGLLLPIQGLTLHGRVLVALLAAADPASFSWAATNTRWTAEPLRGIGQAKRGSSRPGMLGHKAHWGTARPRHCRREAIFHWPCRTLSWTRSLAGLVSIHHDPPGSSDSSRSGTE